MNRYLTSLGITLVVYLVLIVSFFYNKTIDSKSNVSLKKENRVSFRVIKEQEKTVKKIKKEIIKKKIVKKKIVKKKTIKKRKIVKEQMEKKLEKRVVKKEETKEVDKTLVKKEKLHKKSKILNENLLNDEHLKLIRNKYFILVKRTIDNNKSYPKAARRRGVEGSVNVKFELSNKGELVSFHILSGKSMFFKATSKALQKSFPILPPKELQKDKFKLTLNIKYNLH